MIVKLSTVVILILLGALLYVAGVLAPDSVRQEVESRVRRVIPSDIVAPELSNLKMPDFSAAPKKTALPEGTISADQLLLSGTSTDDTRYAVQAGAFADTQHAEALAKRLRDMQYPIRMLSIVDGRNAHWIIVAAGSYTSANDARKIRAALSSQLGVPSMSVIQLPPEKK